MDRQVEIPADALPGLKADDDGFIRGDEYLITLPETLTALADWAENWHDEVNGGSQAVIDLRYGVTLNLWSNALREMAAKY